MPGWYHRQQLGDRRWEVRLNMSFVHHGVRSCDTDGVLSGLTWQAGVHAWLASLPAAGRPQVSHLMSDH
jgi:hypothetical protein